MLLKYSCLSTGRSKRRASSRRGFTLIELVAVVLIIGITAALATPTIATQVRERRSRDTAQRIALLYSSARMRALGRGSAVIVRFREKTGFSVVESIQGTVGFDASRATCAGQAGLGCLSNAWDDPDKSREVETLVPLDVKVVAHDVAWTEQSNMDICFTPMGRSFISFDGTAPRTPMVGATTIDVQRTNDLQGVEGLLRTVAILPNGMARLGL